MEDVGLDDIELVRISTKDLNRHLKRRNIDKKRQKEIKARRRTLKNRFIIVFFVIFGLLIVCNIEEGSYNNKVDKVGSIDQNMGSVITSLVSYLLNVKRTGINTCPLCT